MLIDVTDTTSGGGLSNYSILYNWILAGMQPGGVAAHAVVNGGILGSLAPVPFTFSGVPPLAAGIALDGSQSVGATSFLWSVSGPSGPTGTLPSISNPTSASLATLNLPFVGSYLVQLQVSDGVSSDTGSQTITVSETPVVASFTPGTPGATVNQSVSFSGNPLRGTINLKSTSTGSPTTCQWQVSGPAGATLDGAAVPVTNPPATVAKSCGTAAALSVPSSSINGTYSVTLTATSAVGSSSSATLAAGLTVQSAGSGIVANAGANSTNSLTFTNPSTIVPFGGAAAAPDPSAIPVATVGLDGSASTGPGTLTYTWSVTAQPGNATGAYVPTITNANSVSATLNVHRAGAYQVQLVVSNGLPGPGTALRNITVNANGITFTTMIHRLGNGVVDAGNLGCTGCHVATSVTPPSWDVNDPDRASLYARVTARVNATDPARSLIVTCPAESTQSLDCHNPPAALMGQQTGFNGGNTTNYTEFLNWIISGAPNN